MEVYITKLIPTWAPDPPGKSSGTKATVPCPKGMATSAMPPARDQTSERDLYNNTLYWMYMCMCMSIYTYTHAQTYFT